MYVESVYVKSVYVESVYVELVYVSLQLMKNDAETHYEFFSSGYPPHEIDNSVNPNTASVQNYSYTIPIAPNVTGTIVIRWCYVRSIVLDLCHAVSISYADDMVYCTSLGPVGFAKNGVAIYNALTGQTTDAVKNEVLDQCSGHASPGGAYHYHALSGQSKKHRAFA